MGEEDAKPAVKVEDAPIAGDQDDMRIVETCIANVDAQLPVLRSGWEMVLVMGKSSVGFLRRLTEIHLSSTHVGWGVGFSQGRGGTS